MILEADKLFGERMFDRLKNKKGLELTYFLNFIDAKFNCWLYEHIIDSLALYEYDWQKIKKER